VARAVDQHAAALISMNGVLFQVFAIGAVVSRMVFTRSERRWFVPAPEIGMTSQQHGFFLKQLFESSPGGDARLVTGGEAL
jgi:hypothetical protein